MWALPYVDLRRKKALGRGRALVCYKEGVELIPVLVVGNSEADIDAYVEQTAKKIKFADKPKKKVINKIVRKGKKV